ncbi:GTP-binding protein [Cupriavidus agavae]|uniref:G3E family GTPase n=1 Tax=Cupriavidus agavae TaxID=1001822 RepID=A0A4Q7RXG8_9BURK|nr:GTP-binding protein [Cupriavidus agavae]RZT38584.1 G3E family GTPase [Cupriavidus agavae]
MAARLPVTVLSGFTGAGKTTVLHHLAAQSGARVAVLDSRSDLLAEVERLAQAGQHDFVLIEAAATDEPIGIAEGFAFEDQHGEPGGQAPGVAHLDTLVTVVDASRFLRDFHDADFLSARGLAEADDDRTVVDVLIDQVEVCDVIVINKIDLVDAGQLGRLHVVLRALNPRAELVDASHGNVPAGRVLGTGRFDIDATPNAAGWQAALQGDAVPDAAGVSTLVYRRRRPFHPQRFADLIHTDWMREHGDVLRSRGLFWLASRMDIAGDWAQAGGVCRPGAAGAWWAAIDAGEWPSEGLARAAIEADLLEDGLPAEYGDRRQELVLVGLDLDAGALLERLDTCLLTDDEMAAGPDAWATYPDPFPDWGDAFDDVHDHDHDHGGGHERAHDHDHDDSDGPCGCGHAH